MREKKPGGREFDPLDVAKDRGGRDEFLLDAVADHDKLSGMRRNMDLIRQLLLEVEKTPAGEAYDLETHCKIKGHPREVLQEHFALCDDVGFLQEFQQELSGNGFCSGLTWEGHDFLDAVRADSVWQKVKAKLQAAGVSTSLTIVKEMAVQITRQALGL